MKLGTKITSIIASASLVATFVLTGCTSEAQQVAPLDIKPASLGATTLAALPEASAPEQEIPSDEVVEVVDPTTGETTTMTAAEAKASGKTIVSSGSSSTPQASSGGSAQAPAASSSAPSAPVHQHSWQPVYKTVHHNAVTRSASICTACGADITGQVGSHLEAHILNGESASMREGSITVKEASSEQVFSHYQCSCGATK